MNEILQRIEREVGIEGLTDILTERLSPSDLQSLLLEVMRRRAGKRSAKQILDDYETSRFYRPSVHSPRDLTDWEMHAWKRLPKDFQSLALSPVCPLGTCSVVATVDQNKAVSTIRHSEVVSDSTNVLALECALRRREQLRYDSKSPSVIHLAASHRLLRPQQYANKALSAHFSLIGLCSGGRDRGTLRFETMALQRHIGFYLQAVQAFVGSGWRMALHISDFHPSPRREIVETQLFTPLRDRFPDLDHVFDTERTTGRGYYRDLCFHLYAVKQGSKETVFLADGGSVDWNEKYLSNTKERLVISGIGSDRVCGMRDTATE